MNDITEEILGHQEGNFDEELLNDEEEIFADDSFDENEEFEQEQVGSEEEQDEESEEGSDEELDIKLEDGQELKSVEGDIIFQESDFEDYPALKSLAGKSHKDLIKGYNSSISLITTTRQENKTLLEENSMLAFEKAKLQKEINDLRLQPQTDKTEQSDEINWDDCPDPMDDFTGFKKFMAKAQSQPKQKVEQQPQKVSVQQSQNEAIVMQTVQASLPQDVNFQEAMNDFVMQNRSILVNPDNTLNEENFQILLQDPSRVVKGLLNSAKKVAKSKQMKVKSKVKDLSQEAQKVTNKLKTKSNKVVNESRTTTIRTTNKPTDATDRTIASLLDIVPDER